MNMKVIFRYLFSNCSFNFLHFDGVEIGESTWGDTRIHSQRLQLIFGFFSSYEMGHYP